MCRLSETPLLQVLTVWMAASPTAETRHIQTSEQHIPAALSGKCNDAATDGARAALVVGVLAVSGALRQPQEPSHELAQDVRAVILDRAMHGLQDLRQGLERRLCNALCGAQASCKLHAASTCSTLNLSAGLSELPTSAFRLSLSLSVELTHSSIRWMHTCCTA